MSITFFCEPFHRVAGDFLLAEMITGMLAIQTQGQIIEVSEIFCQSFRFMARRRVDEFWFHGYECNDGFFFSDVRRDVQLVVWIRRKERNNGTTDTLSLRRLSMCPCLGFWDETSRC